MLEVLAYFYSIRCFSLTIPIEMKVAIEACNQQNHALKEKIAGLELAVAGHEARKIHEQLESRFEEQKRELISEWETKLQEKQYELDAVNSQVQTMEIEVRHAKVDNEGSLSMVESLQRQLQKERRAAESTEENLTKKLRESRAKVDKLRDQIAELRLYKQLTTKQLSERENEVAEVHSEMLRLRSEQNSRDLLLHNQEEGKSQLEVQMRRACEKAEMAEAEAVRLREKLAGERNQRHDWTAQIQQLQAQLEAGEKSRDELSRLLKTRTMESHRNAGQNESVRKALAEELRQRELEVSKLRQDMNTLSHDAETRIRGLEDNVRVLCSSLEHSNNMLGQREARAQQQAQLAEGERQRRGMEDNLMRQVSPKSARVVN